MFFLRWNGVWFAQPIPFRALWYSASRTAAALGPYCTVPILSQKTSSGWWHSSAEIMRCLWPRWNLRLMTCRWGHWPLLVVSGCRWTVLHSRRKSQGGQEVLREMWYSLRYPGHAMCVPGTLMSSEKKQHNTRQKNTSSSFHLSSSLSSCCLSSAVIMFLNVCV